MFQVWFKNRRAKWRKQKREEEASQKSGDVRSASGLLSPDAALRARNGDATSPSDLNSPDRDVNSFSDVNSNHNKSSDEADFERSSSFEEKDGDICVDDVDEREELEGRSAEAFNTSLSLPDMTSSPRELPVRVPQGHFRSSSSAAVLRGSHDLDHVDSPNEDSEAELSP